MAMKRSLSIAALFSLLCTLALPVTASAEFLSLYARGHGSYLLGPGERLQYFDNNDAGLGYGFQVGAEVVQIDLFLDANFHPQGSAWNQLGIGWDMDFAPGPLFVEPGAQLVYFFGKQHDGTEGVKGLFPRVGVQLGVEFAKVIYLGAESWVGYVVSIPDPQTGLVYMGAAFLGLRFSAF